MPTHYKSPYASSFKAACNKGASYNQVVWNLAKRNNTTANHVWESLFKAGFVGRQKFNGSWIYFPWNCHKGTASSTKVCQHLLWQCFTEWCILSGCCTPEQMWNNSGNQKDFMTWCKKFFVKQNVGTTTFGKSFDRSSNNFSFSTVRSRTTRRYRKAA
jgi:hypothetical protein